MDSSNNYWFSHLCPGSSVLCSKKLDFGMFSKISFVEIKKTSLQFAGDTLLQRTTIFLTYLLLFSVFFDKAVLLSLTTFPFILNVLTYLRIAFIQKVETI